MRLYGDFDWYWGFAILILLTLVIGGSLLTLVEGRSVGQPKIGYVTSVSNGEAKIARLEFEDGSSVGIEGHTNHEGDRVCVIVRRGLLTEFETAEILPAKACD